MEGVIQTRKLTYTVQEAAQVLGVSTSNMYQIIRMQGFPVIVIGKRRLIPIKKLETWMEEMADLGWRN